MRPLALLVLLPCACSGDGGPHTEDEPGCPVGHVMHPESESCVALGIQGCAAAFVDEDGLCRPSIDKCLPGTIPKFSEGCVPVGIPGCPAEFIEADGLCHPSMDKCPQGTFAIPTVGCVSIDGDGCGTGTWGNIADEPNTIWVDPAYLGMDGDGT